MALNGAKVTAYDSLFRCVGTGRMILVKNSLCQ